MAAPGNYVIADGVVSAVPGRPVLVVSDLDDTMVGDDAASAQFKDWWEQVRRSTKAGPLRWV